MRGLLLWIFLGSFILIVASCQNPITSTTRYTPGPQVSGLPLGNGITVYAGMGDYDVSPYFDTYHTGLLVFPNGGNLWTQLLTNHSTVNDVYVSGSTIAVAEPKAVLYSPDGGQSWATNTLGGSTQVNQVYLESPTVYVATSAGLQTLATPNLPSATPVTLSDNSLDNNATSLYATSPSTFFVGMATGLVLTNGSTNQLVTSGIPHSAYINGVFSLGSKIYVGSPKAFRSQTA